MIDGICGTCFLTAPPRWSDTLAEEKYARLRIRILRMSMITVDVHCRVRDVSMKYEMLPQGGIASQLSLHEARY